MKTKTKQAKIINMDELSTLRYPLSGSWKKGIGLLKSKGINPLRYQQKIRKGWGKRLKRQATLAQHAR